MYLIVFLCWITLAGHDENPYKYFKPKVMKTFDIIFLQQLSSFYSSLILHFPSARNTVAVYTNFDEDSNEIEGDWKLNFSVNWNKWESVDKDVGKRKADYERLVTFSTDPSLLVAYTNGKFLLILLCCKCIQKNHSKFIFHDIMRPIFSLKILLNYMV